MKKEFFVMISAMSKTAKKEKEITPFSRVITRARLRAGSMTKLVDELGEPLLKVRTLEEWEQVRRSPPDYVEAAIIERLEKYLKK